EIRAWQVLESRYLVERPWLSLRQDRVMTGHGTNIDEFHVLEVPTWACVCCIDENGCLVLIRQYRHGIGRVTLELPAGVIESSETPLEGARRELLEETGYTSDDWTALPTLAPEPARHTNHAHCFVARHARRTGQQNLDEVEDLAVELFPASDLMRRIEAGEITHAVHVAALLWAKQRGLLEA
ncbi:MAG TPA: NUDIX hydrolase, partial [Polyangiaceae bacterium]|nr:NUDIX hydrolase [Polyangiaceae bacterium]